MPSKEYAKTLHSLSINLIVKDIEAAVAFQRQVLGAEVVYSDPDFAVVRGCGAEWMLHADHTYEDHPLSTLLTGEGKRGVGVELRLHGCDPDAAEAAAERLGFRVLSPATDKPYGLREAHILDADGYDWVPDVPMAEE
jgi:catechol 2,3-dioxygenase-like lactoylglutathione lyase family enzyme